MNGHLNVGPSLHRFTGTLTPSINVRHIRPVGDFRKLLVISASYKESRKSETVGYVTYRRKDNHKQLFIVDGCETRKWDGQLPQTKKTSIPMLAQIMGFGPDVKLSIRDKTGFTGPSHCAGEPQFKTGCVVGSAHLI